MTNKQLEVFTATLASSVDAIASAVASMATAVGMQTETLKGLAALGEQVAGLNEGLKAQQLMVRRVQRNAVIRNQELAANLEETGNGHFHSS